jgi:hypothetical protein
MSPSVMTLPARNFKFLTQGSLERTRNYRLCEKEGSVEIGAVTLGFRFQIPLIKPGVRFSATGLRTRLFMFSPTAGKPYSQPN